MWLYKCLKNCLLKWILRKPWDHGNNEWSGPRIVIRNIGSLSLGTMEPIIFEFWNKVLKTELILNLITHFNTLFEKTDFTLLEKCYFLSSILCLRLNCFKFCISVNVRVILESDKKNYWNIVNHHCLKNEVFH